MISLKDMSTKELLAHYNEHSGKPPVAKWKSKVSDLVARLLKLRPDLFFVGDEPTFEAPADELKGQKGRPVDHDDQPEPEKKPRAKAPKPDAEPSGERGAIRRYCEELLLAAKGEDPKTHRPLGLPYGVILEKVCAKFPEANTSLNCLRWYATKMNKRTGKERVVMPIRPKAAKAAEAA